MECSSAFKSVRQSPQSRGPNWKLGNFGLRSRDSKNFSFSTRFSFSAAKITPGNRLLISLTKYLKKCRIWPQVHRRHRQHRRINRFWLGHRLLGLCLTDLEADEHSNFLTLLIVGTQSKWIKNKKLKNYSATFLN